MATTKSLRTSTPRFCTILDVCNKFTRIVATSINLDQSDSPIVLYDDQIDDSIVMASQRIYTALLPTYKSLTALEESAPWVGSIISNRQNTTPSARLLAASAGASAICEHFTLTFASSTAYTATGFLSGDVGSGTTTTDFTSSGDGDLIISASSVTGLFSGTFAATDKVFISINKWNRFVASIAVYYAVADVLKNLAFANGISIDPGIFERYSNHAKADLMALQKPYEPGGYQLAGLPSRDFSDIQLGDWSGNSDSSIVDRFGNYDEEMLGTVDIDSYTS